MRCPVNKLLVTIEKKYQDKEGNLLIDTSFAPEEYATLKGVVVSVPDKVEDVYYKGHIDQIAKLGDEIWFGYGVVYDYEVYREGETPVYRNLIQFEGEEYWAVRYEEVFCVVRNGEILMPTQHVLLSPVQVATISGALTSLEKPKDRGRVIAVPEMDISCKEGDIVPIEKEFTQEYIIFGKPHYIMPVRRLIAKF